MYLEPVWSADGTEIFYLDAVNNLVSVAVTAGYQSREPRAEFYEHMDAANVDLKGFSKLVLGKYWRRATPAREVVVVLVR